MSGLVLPSIPSLEVVACGVFLRQQDAARWLLVRATKHGEWGFPKGHQDPGEDLVTTALRETVEETGIALLKIVGQPVVNRYVLPSGRRKTTVYFPAVTATTEVILSDEHDAFRWASHSEIRTLLNHPVLITRFSQTAVSWPAATTAV